MAMAPVSGKAMQLLCASGAQRFHAGRGAPALQSGMSGAGAHLAFLMRAKAPPTTRISYYIQRVHLLQQWMRAMARDRGRKLQESSSAMARSPMLLRLSLQVTPQQVRLLHRIVQAGRQPSPGVQERIERMLQILAGKRDLSRVHARSAQTFWRRSRSAAACIQVKSDGETPGPGWPNAGTGARQNGSMRPRHAQRFIHAVQLQPQLPAFQNVKSRSVIGKNMAFLTRMSVLQSRQFPVRRQSLAGERAFRVTAATIARRDADAGITAPRAAGSPGLQRIAARLEEIAAAAAGHAAASPAVAPTVLAHYHAPHPATRILREAGRAAGTDLQNRIDTRIQTQVQSLERKVQTRVLHEIVHSSHTQEQLRRVMTDSLLSPQMLHALADRIYVAVERHSATERYRRGAD
ncbi:hypothetical protein [Collimonas silvisoli]|uniref:hypothetical protein n=1 Tax=Collimonas silvisoli TaxID=2825884 RepID=UPI001B8B5472|nr:hypothetical protein [Collimonas silvisoli]